MRLSLFVILFISMFSIKTHSQNARVQFIHNSADTSIKYVDIYWNSTLLYNNFVFHRASPFINRVGGTAAIISIADSSSTSSEDAFATFDFTPAASEKYVLIFQGIQDDAGYSSYQPFDLKIIQGAREVGLDYATVDMMFVNGCTDAGEFDINETWLIQVPLAQALSFNDHQEYISLFAGDYRMRVAESNSQMGYGDFDAPFTQMALNGKAVTIVTSGFSNPIENSSGQLMGMWMARAEGGMMTEFASSTTSLKIINNSADVQLNEIDVYWNNDRVFDNLPFRHSSQIAKRRFSNNVTVSIAPANSTSSADALFAYPLQPMSADTTMLVLMGLSNNTGYSDFQPLSFIQLSHPLFASGNAGEVSVSFINGVTDFPVYDLVIPDETPLQDNVQYETLFYYNVVAQNQHWAIREAAGSYEITRYYVPFEGFLSSSALVMGSGFYNPALNNNGAEYGLWMATEEAGPLIELERIQDSFASVRFVNNSSDGYLNNIKVYVNDELAISDLSFSATMQTEVKANADIVVKFVPNGQPLTNAVYASSYHLNSDNLYLILLDGIESIVGYNPVPEVNVHIVENPFPGAQVNSEVDAMFYNGSTDVGSIRITELESGDILADDLNFGNFETQNIQVTSTEDVILKVSTTNGDFVFGYYILPTSTDGLSGENVYVLSHGFWNPVNNSNGSAFGMWALREDGSLTQLETFAYVGIDDEPKSSQLVLSPNPSKETITLSRNGKIVNDGSLYSIRDTKGRLVVDGRIYGEVNISWLASGLYYLQTKEETLRMIVVE